MAATTTTTWQMARSLSKQALLKLNDKIESYGLSVQSKFYVDWNLNKMEWTRNGVDETLLNCSNSMLQ